MSSRSDDFDSVVELYTRDDFRQLVAADTALQMPRRMRAKSWMPALVEAVEALCLDGPM
ncbi:MAG: hypothetical protein ACREQO_21840 [Candidatus Binatia bacterium]